MPLYHLGTHLSEQFLFNSYSSSADGPPLSNGYDVRLLRLSHRYLEVAGSSPAGGSWLISANFLFLRDYWKISENTKVDCSYLTVRRGESSKRGKTRNAIM